MVHHRVPDILAYYDHQRILYQRRTGVLSFHAWSASGTLPDANVTRCRH